MIRIDTKLTPNALQPFAERLFEISGKKVGSLQKSWNPRKGSPVFTVGGKYQSRGWTEWTQGFFYGSAILQFDATGDAEAIAFGREGTLRDMASHVSHIGVHDHGFNNVSTYGNLHRLAREGRLAADPSELDFYELALKVSGAVQAARWTDIPGNLGYIYSFNGPHSLFADTIRSLRVLGISHQLGHFLMGERDRKISLLGRLISHAETTARYNVYFGEGRDHYDVDGRVAHESIFNLNDGSYRCPSTQQGYSPFSTWTRGLAWILCGYAEQLEFLSTLPESSFGSRGLKGKTLARFLDVAKSTAEFFIRNTPVDGIPYWDTGAPGLVRLGNYLDRPAEPFNDHEPVDSSAAAIAAQGLIRLGNYLRAAGKHVAGRRYLTAGLTVAKTLFGDGYLSTSAAHQGLILHAVYHRPNGWDHIPKGRKVPCGESCMWGDYHARELALLILRMAKGEPYYAFFIR
jgi:unsaturated chondroitin disaccharide hydrolase